MQIGLDIVEISRFKGMVKKTNFLRNVFTELEQTTCDKKIDLVQSLAVRYAAKEAVRKTIEYNVKYNCIEILNNPDGKPIVNILDQSIKDRYEFQLSLSHTTEYAAAICLTITK